ncbi:DUF3413 domain-containing protein [Salinicola salarius]|uniref:DUF3413 domain-containing protein n=1 Tax=Salinicola salarius TaxID=430457 RepID=UPI000DA15FF0|nr:DUF3413 domain-containing protein [Salinicola salarius]MDF3918287.1 DUF3413 domain-containing protein [Salinicola salarius]MED5499301.1 DUF3413 domain-containing protein [Pseudomonadota bacterium]
MQDTLRRRWRSTLLFALFQLPLVWLIALRYVPYLAIPHDPMGIAYLILTWIGHFGMLVLLGWLPLAVLAVVTRARWLWLPATLLGALGLSALLLDTVVYAQYRFHVNAFMVSLFLNDKNGEIFSFATSTWLVVVGCVAVALALEGWLAHRLIVGRRGQRLPAGLACGTILVTLIASHALHVVADARYQRSVTQQVGIYPLLFPATAKDFMEKHGWLDPRAARAERADIDTKQAQNLDWPRNPLSCQAEAPPNVLVVLIDSWRADEYGPENTPNLYAALNDSGRRYLDHYSGGNATRNGTMSLFYGLTGNYYAYLDDTQTPPLLITQLQKQGYAMGIFSSASLDGVGFDRTIFSSVSPLRLSTPGNSPAGRDQKMTEDWLDWLDQQEQQDDSPWFGMLFYDAPHGYDVPDDAEQPYQPSVKRMDYLDLGPDTDPTPYFNRHRNSVHYDDELLGRVIADLKAKGEWDDTMLVVTADHGQSFNDFGRNYWGHNSNFASPQVLVPMIVNGPGVEPGRVEGMTSHLDVAPMLMRHALGCTNPLSDYAMGKDLLAPGIDHPWIQSSSYIDYGIVEPDRITVVDGTGQWDIVDRQLKPIDDAEFSPAVFEAMQWFRQFYR